MNPHIAKALERFEKAYSSYNNIYQPPKEWKKFVKTFLQQELEELEKIVRAEQKKEWATLLSVIFQHSSMHSTHNKYCAACDLKKAIDEALPKLNQSLKEETIND